MLSAGENTTESQTKKKKKSSNQVAPLKGS